MNGEVVALITAGLDGGGKVDVDELAARIVGALVSRLAGTAGNAKAARPGRRTK